MSAVGHVMIRASAGSGKTHALTTRYIRLLALGAGPERIVALTFTRKAAGEFFDRILKRLAEAALEPAKAAALAHAIELPAMGGADFLRLLRVTVDAMHLLKLGTLDSFFARIARAFPLELGLTGDFELLDGHGMRLERDRVLRRMFAQAGSLSPSQRDFIEAFKRATFGLDEKRLGLRLDGFLDRHHELFLGARAAGLWGDPARIWPEGSVFLEGAGINLAEAARELGLALEGLPLTGAQQGFWREFLGDIAGWTPGSKMTNRIENIFGNAMAAWPDLAVIVVARKKMALPDGARRALRQVVVAIVGMEIAAHLKVTRGIHAVLAAYDGGYHDAVRRSGKLTFADIQRLLEPTSAPSLTREEDGGGSRLFIDYRLDAEIDHWLLDEFQDTSFGQWSVLKNLIDEVVQDPTARRSFFYVGDAKQSIFAWRDGDARLFREIFDFYNQVQPGTIAEQRLVKSWRSGPPIVEAVNRVFGDARAIGVLFPGGAASRWNAEWLPHETERMELGGQAALLHAADENESASMLGDLLLEIRPLERGLSCAVLVQRNETAVALADFIRRHAGIAAVAESEIAPCTDNPFGAVLLALVKAAAHPGDTLAHEHIAMTPLGGILRRKGISTPDELSQHLLTRIYSDGYERTLSAWAGELEKVLPTDDAFSRERSRLFIAAAAAFDATGSRDAAEFAAFMAAYRQREADAGAAVRVMTIHKAKGLDFDVVFLPDLEGQKLDQMREGLGIDRGPDRSVKWVLDLPAKKFTERDPVLAAYVQAAEADNCYEKLSLLYVAMTRAKRGLYVITTPPGSSESRNYRKLLADTLGETAIAIQVGDLALRGGFAAGNSSWHREFVPPDRPAPRPRAIEPLLAVGGAAGAGRLAARRPSDFQSPRKLDAGAILSARRRDAASRGTTVHGLLAEVAWLDAAEIEPQLRRWSARGVPGASVEAAANVLRSQPRVWSRPTKAERFEIWRERAFEVVVDETWISGVFDRVVIERDEGGAAISGVIFDFKTDRLSQGEERDVAERYAGQLGIYSRALSRLTGLAGDRIKRQLIFSETGGIVKL